MTIYALLYFFGKTMTLMGGVSDYAITETDLINDDQYNAVQGLRQTYNENLYDMREGPRIVTDIVNNDPVLIHPGLLDVLSFKEAINRIAVADPHALIAFLNVLKTIWSERPRSQDIIATIDSLIVFHTNKIEQYDIIAWEGTVREDDL